MAAADDVQVAAGDAASQPSSFPALGKTRCYWAVMDSMMNFRYLDPVLQFHMQEQASAMIGKNLVDFIHPEEKDAAKADFAKFRSSTTIFGSVTRCRYARTSHCRRILGAQNPETDQDGAAKYLDENWLACRVTASVVADNAVLTFFHALQDVNPEADNDDSNPNDWTNWCGPRISNPRRDYFMSYNQQMLEQAFDICQNESEEIEAKVARIEQGTETAGAPTYVFQILDSSSGEIYFTWPPTKPTGYKIDKVLYGQNQEDRYSPNEYALLAKGVIQKPRSNVAAETNCTKRFQSQHPILKDDQMTNIESVVVTFQALTFVCFQTGGILLNSKSVSLAPGLPNALKRKADDGNEVDDATDEAIKRLRQATGEDGGPYAQNGGDGTNDGGFPAMPSPTHAQFNQAWNPDVNDQSLQSGYYQSSTYPSVYSSMFQANVEDGGFMSGSTNIPPMPAPSQATAGGANNGLQNLALASTSSYYTDYNPNGQYGQMPDGGDPSLSQFIPRQRGEVSGSGGEETAGEGAAPTPTLHRVRKNDKNRICTSCGTTNSPEWRKGPSGIKTLCNACGLRYSRAQARKAKKARKEEEAGLASGGGGGGSGADTPNTPNYIPAPLQMTTSGQDFGNGSDGSHHSPYLSVGDYASQQILPPLPHTGNSDGTQGDNGQDNNGDTQVPSSTHPGSTAPNYGGYGAFHGFTPYGEWSPNNGGSFSQQQGQMPQQGSQG